jgi:outer membrane protein
MWKKKLNKMFCAALFLLLSPIVDGQERYDLPALINRVLAENYQIQIVRNEEKIAANNNTPGNAGFLPTLDLQATKSQSNNNTRLQYFTGVVKESSAAKSSILNGYVIMNWMVFDGFRMFAKKDQLGFLQEMGAVDTRYYIEQTISDIANSWYQLIKENNLLDNYIETLGISRFRLFLEKKKLDVGSGNLLLYNQALVDYNSDSLAVMSQKRLIKSLVIHVNLIAKLEPGLEITMINNSILPEMVDEEDSLVEKAVQSNREIKMALLQEMVAESNVRLQKADYYPEINLYGQYSYNKQTNEIGTIQNGKTYGRQVGVTVRFNLFNGFNDKREVVNTKIIRENSDLEKEKITSQIKSAVFDNYFQYKSITQQLVIADQNTLAAQKSLDIAKIQYEHGAISGFDFRQTQLSLIRAQNTATLLRFTLKSIEIELNLLSGNILKKYVGG